MTSSLLTHKMKCELLWHGLVIITRFRKPGHLIPWQRPPAKCKAATHGPKENLDADKEVAVLEKEHTAVESIP
jgi:hypothetical protein